jgi:hypothetical protein
VIHSLKRSPVVKPIQVKALLLVLVAALVAIPMGSATAGLLIQPPTAGSPTGSWNWGLGFAGVDYDQLAFSYRPDLDTGGGMFEAPYFANFHEDPWMSGPAAAGWGVDSGSSTVVWASGNQRLAADGWLWMQNYFTGDASLRTGFNVVALNQGTVVYASQLEVGENFTLFQESAITPEPGSIALMGLGLLGVLGVVRKRRMS